MRKILLCIICLWCSKNSISQNVGIGIANPNVKLHIINGTPATLANSTGFLLIGENRFANIVADSNRLQARYNGAAAPLSLQPFNGNIGIGNLSGTPASRLHIAGGIEVSANTNGSLLIGETASNNMAFDANEIQARNNAAASPIYIQSMGGNSFFGPGNIITNGKIGIGQPNPAVQLHIEGGSDASLTTGGFVQFGASNGANLVIDNNEIMARNDSGTATLTLQNNGGKTLIGEDLEINGNIQGAVKLEQLAVETPIDGNIFTITVGNNSLISITNSSPVNTIYSHLALTDGEAIGQILIIRCLGGYHLFSDDPTYNININSNMLLKRDSTLTLLWGGNYWIEISRTAN